MRKINKWLVSALIVTGVTSGSLLWAQQGQNSGRGMGQGYRSEAQAEFREPSARQLSQLPNHLRAIMQQEMNQNRIQALTELSGRSPAAVQQVLRAQPMRLALAELEVSQAQFQASMHTKMVLSVREAEASGQMTAEEAGELYQMMGSGDHGPRR